MGIGTRGPAGCLVIWGVGVLDANVSSGSEALLGMGLLAEGLGPDSAGVCLRPGAGLGVFDDKPFLVLLRPWVRVDR